MLFAALGVFSAPVCAQVGACPGMTVGQLTSLNGYIPLPASSLWNTNISAAPVDPNSAKIISAIGSSVALHPDFGAGSLSGHSVGIPYQIVSGTQAKVNVTLGTYASESDPGPEPIPSNALIEGYPKPGEGDRHVLVLDKDNCWLYELYGATLSKKGDWSAASSAIWDLTANEKRPYTWTSADAAGLPIFPGLARYDEVAAGVIKHALRFTLPNTPQGFTPPASHWASSNTGQNLPPMGMRMRLKSTFDTSGFPAQAKVILNALKTYGMILADNGSAIYLSGAPNSGWNNTDLNSLKRVTAAEFDIILISPLYTPATVPSGPAPNIGSFTSSAAVTVSRGAPVTLNWSVSNSEYNIIAPQAGPVRGNSVVVTPSVTTTYTLYSTNQYGRTSKSVTVTVP
jgi:hypothetical protein